MIPACRIPPPRIFLFFLARSIRSLLPTTSDPTGQLRPLDRQKLTVSAGPASSAGEKTVKKKAAKKKTKAVKKKAAKKPVANKPADKKPAAKPGQTRCQAG